MTFLIAKYGCEAWIKRPCAVAGGAIVANDPMWISMAPAPAAADRTVLMRALAASIRAARLTPV